MPQRSWPPPGFLFELTGGGFGDGFPGLDLPIGTSQPQLPVMNRCRQISKTRLSLMATTPAPGGVQIIRCER